MAYGSCRLDLGRLGWGPDGLDCDLFNFLDFFLNVCLFMSAYWEFIKFCFSGCFFFSSGVEFIMKKCMKCFETWHLLLVLVKSVLINLPTRYVSINDAESFSIFIYLLIKFFQFFLFNCYFSPTAAYSYEHASGWKNDGALQYYSIFADTWISIYQNGWRYALQYGYLLLSHSMTISILSFE